MTLTRSLGAGLVAALAIGAACYQDESLTGPSGRPLAKVLLTDAPFPFDTVQSVNIYVVSIAASTTADTSDTPGSQEWVTITEPRQRFDLLELQRGATALVGAGEIPADLYRAIRVIIDADSSGIVFDDGTAAVVHWGGSGQMAIHAFVEAALEVPAQGAEIVIDFDVGRSFRYDDLADGSFTFIPWIRAVNEAATGDLLGTVVGDPGAGSPAPIENATVSAYGHSDGAWQIFSTGRTDAAGNYRIAYLRAGSYIVQVDPPASSGWGSDRDSSVSVTAGAETNHSVTLVPFEGSVTILGASSMLQGRTNVLEAIVVDGQSQQVPNPSVTWANLDPAVLQLRDSTVSKYASVTSLAEGQGRIVATSGGLSDTLVITVAADTTGGGTAARR